MLQVLDGAAVDGLVPPQVSVRVMASRLKVRTVWLVRELVGDGVPVAQVSERRYMVGAGDFGGWWARRQERARLGAQRQGATA